MNRPVSVDFLEPLSKQLAEILVVLNLVFILLLVSLPLLSLLVLLPPLFPHLLGLLLLLLEVLHGQLFVGALFLTNAPFLAELVEAKTSTVPAASH